MSRFRTMYDFSKQEKFTSFSWISSLGSDTIAYDTYEPLIRSKYMRDVVTPNWKSLRAKGVIVNNPMLLYDHTETTTLSHTHRDGYHNVNNHIEAYWKFKPYSSVAFRPLMDEKAVHSFLASLSDERNLAVTQSWADVDVSEIQALASLGEMPETVRWIASLLKRALDIIRAIKGKSLKRAVARQFSSGKRSIDTVSDFWLELRYAMRPLVFEMQQAVTALKTTVKRAMRQTARGYKRVQEVATSYDTNYEGGCDVRTRTTVVRRSNYRAGVLYAIDSDINGILALWGFDQPLETIWELTPFSFIADWFFNVGDIISSWSLNAGLHPLTSFVTDHHELIVEVAHTGTFWRPATTYYDWDVEETITYGRSSQVISIKNRYPNPSRSYLPTCNIKLDVAKITDLAFIGRTLLQGLGDSFLSSRRTLRV